ncbi:hypothetical protein AK812_SmicGene33831 [Symbiodinium microadriaticum]|uniref:Uncharacterized protein n=1 Tax=Symbiodinium microadriaticum TaxID=2951 RepID=A0A1Q9CQK7_SYMMI|nr:hypothetical protein AK812_SmicGene33831 [Symbiodinium microadriaticum]
MRINSPVKLAKEGSKKGVGADQNGVTSVCRPGSGPDESSKARHKDVSEADLSPYLAGYWFKKLFVHQGQAYLTFDGKPEDDAASEDSIDEEREICPPESLVKAASFLRPAEAALQGSPVETLSETIAAFLEQRVRTIREMVQSRHNSKIARMGGPPAKVAKVPELEVVITCGSTFPDSDTDADTDSTQTTALPLEKHTNTSIHISPAGVVFPGTEDRMLMIFAETLASLVTCMEIVVSINIIVIIFIIIIIIIITIITIICSWHDSWQQMRGPGERQKQHVVSKLVAFVLLIAVSSASRYYGDRLKLVITAEVQSVPGCHLQQVKESTGCRVSISQRSLEAIWDALEGSSWVLAEWYSERKHKASRQGEG